MLAILTRHSEKLACYSSLCYLEWIISALDCSLPKRRIICAAGGKSCFQGLFPASRTISICGNGQHFLHLSSLATNKEKILREITVHGFLRAMSATSFAVIGVIGSFESEMANSNVVTDFMLKVNQKLPLIVQRFSC